MALEIGLLRSSFELVHRREPGFTRRFYEQLFARYPQAKTLFHRRSSEGQDEVLAGALVAVLDHLHDAPWLRQQLGALGATHAEYGVTREMYAWVGEALLATLAEIAGDDWSEDLACAWAAAYGAITSMMLDGTELRTTR